MKKKRDKWFRSKWFKRLPAMVFALLTALVFYYAVQTAISIEVYFKLRQSEQKQEQRPSRFMPGVLSVGLTSHQSLLIVKDLQPHS